jgi:hypothetical protein
MLLALITEEAEEIRGAAINAVKLRSLGGAILERLRLCSTNECPGRDFIARGSAKRRGYMAGNFGGKNKVRTFGGKK